MEYLFHRHSDLYAGAKGQRWIEGRKTAARHSCFFFPAQPLVKDEQREGWFNHSNLHANSKSVLWLIQ